MNLINRKKLSLAFSLKLSLELRIYIDPVAKAAGTVIVFPNVEKSWAVDQP